MSISKKLTPELFDFWVKNSYNVLFEGRHGVGKTALVKECFERNKLKWRYFSASTMDPWCDFVGIPRVVQGPNGENTLEYVLPKDFSDDSVEALFFDEFNRSHKKVRDAVMELIQFKSINGRKFKNLKVVWAAINPPGDVDGQSEYQVENLDPALQDRFHIYVQVPFTPDASFFRKQFGSIGKNAVEWWRELPENVQTLISPRRMEYALRVFEAKGNVGYVLPKECNIKQLELALNQGTIASIAKNIMLQKDVKAATTWLADANNLNAVLGMLGRNKEYRNFFIPLIPQESTVLAMTRSNIVLKYVVANEKTNRKYHKLLDTILAANQNRKLVNYIKRNRIAAPPKIDPTLAASLNSALSQGTGTTNNRWKLLKQINENILTSASAKVKPADLQKATNVMFGMTLKLLERSQVSAVQFSYARVKLMNQIKKTLAKYSTQTTRKALFNKYLKSLKKNQTSFEKVTRFNKLFKLA